VVKITCKEYEVRVSDPKTIELMVNLFMHTEDTENTTGSLTEDPRDWFIISSK